MSQPTEPQAAGPPPRNRQYPHPPLPVLVVLIPLRSASTSSTDYSSSASTSRTDNSSQVPKHWADRHLDEPLNLSPVHWPDIEESETASNLVEVSPETMSFLQSCFGKLAIEQLRQARAPQDGGCPQGGRHKMPQVGPCGERERLEGDEACRYHPSQDANPSFGRGGTSSAHSGVC
ncbi:MAG: hypothetical protein MJE68_23115 [Proteobacteria bacterium]|nr:hypothetical protein [Pseudomonadota bacterium]